MEWTRVPCGPVSAAAVLALLAACGGVFAVRAEVITDGFEAYPPGEFAGGVWHDVIERVGDPSVSAPTATVIETIDAQGAPTRALQTVDAYGSSSGAFAPIDDASQHEMSIDVRIDKFAAANQGWPIGVGYVKDIGFSDINENPQGLVYAWTDRRWHLFVSQGMDRPALDVIIDTPLIDVGTWYTITLSADTDTGKFNAAVYDAATGEFLGRRRRTVSNWDVDRGSYDAIAMFDGELQNATTAGQATVDNMHYVPEPSTALGMVALLAGLARRRRRVCGCRARGV